MAPSGSAEDCLWASQPLSWDFFPPVPPPSRALDFPASSSSVYPSGVGVPRDWAWVSFLPALGVQFPAGTPPKNPPRCRRRWATQQASLAIPAARRAPKPQRQNVSNLCGKLASTTCQHPVHHSDSASCPFLWDTQIPSFHLANSPTAASQMFTHADVPMKHSLFPTLGLSFLGRAPPGWNRGWEGDFTFVQPASAILNTIFWVHIQSPSIPALPGRHLWVQELPHTAHWVRECPWPPTCWSLVRGAALPCVRSPAGVHREAMLPVPLPGFSWYLN